MNTQKPDPAGLVEADRPQRAVSIRRGSLYLPREMYDLYFAGAQTVALVARESGARVAELDPLEGLTAAEEEAGEDYFSIMRRNLATLEEGLGCRS